MIRHRMHDLRKWSQAAPRGERARRRRSHCLLEGLEDRILLSGTPTMYMVDLTSDTGTKTSTDAGDLLYCITQANANPNTAGSEIQFDPTVFTAATPRTITLSSTLELKETAGPEVIDGPGATVVTISGNNAVEVFDDPQADVTATLSELTITGGMTNATGGGINNDGTLTVTNSTIEKNSADFGGGIYNDGILAVTGSVVETNTVTGFGGGIDNADGGTATLTNTTVAKNSAVNNGGGILNQGQSALTLTDSAVSQNSAVSGGGIDNNNSKLTVTGSTLSGNDCTGTKGSVGGGIDNTGGTASITGSTFSGNAAVKGGGGIFTSVGALTITASTLSDNSVSEPGGPGGGIDENSGTLTITDSTIAGNSANGVGAGIQENEGALTAVNCTIAYNYEHSGTESGDGGGMDITQGPVTLYNTIIALNTDGPGLGGPADNIYSEGNPVSSASADNLIGNGGGNSGLTNGVNHNQVGVANPGLGTLAKNGGPTETIALLAGSPAIDAGSNSLAVDAQGKPLTTDQRGAGFPRIVNGTVDIGAFERPIVSAGPTVYTVDLTSDSGASTSALAGDLLYCITQANANTNLAGTEIEFSPTVFKAGMLQTITLTSSLELSEPSGPETIVGPGNNVVTISGNNSVEVFDVKYAATATLSGLTISDGMADSGGGILNDGTLTVTDSTITNNHAGAGGGIENRADGRLTASDCTISDNTAKAGAGIDNSAKLTVTGCTISDNDSHGSTSVSGGGGINNDGGTASIAGSTLSDNSSVLGGGGLFVTAGALTITDTTISDNESLGGSGDSGGGGINQKSGALAITNSTISGNTAVADGGGIESRVGCTLTVTNSTLDKNSSSSQYGGAISSQGMLTVTGTTLSENSAVGGGGINNYGTMTVTYCTIASNGGTRFGGGISNLTGGTATLTNTTVDENTASQDGGGTGSGAGGGIDNYGTMTVANSTFAGNSAFYNGGGINNDGPLTAVNCTIAFNNVANGPDVGGGLYAQYNTAILYNTIVDLNTDGTGSGAPSDDIYVNGGAVSSASAYNLIGTGGNSGLTNGSNGNQVGVVNPGLDTGLAGNGGPTQTIALLAGSPALDKGTATITGVTVPGTDQRGFPRTSGDDIGAFQVDPVPTTVYLNNAYAGDAPGTAVTWTDGSTHYVGYDAFRTIQAGVAAVASGGTVDVLINSGDRYIATPNSGNTSLDISFDGNPEGSISGGDTIGFAGSGGTVTIDGESGSASDVFTIEDTSVQYNAADGLHGMTIDFNGTGFTRNVIAQGTTNTFDIEGAGSSGPSGDLKGDAGTNAFVFGATGKLLGNITGGGQTTLSYAAYSSGATVNLGNGTDGTATGVGGSVAGITAVIGSNFNDTLSAGSVPGVALTGGLGTNSLSGTGAGDSVLESIASRYTLSDTNLSGSGASLSDNLSGIMVADLTGNAFTVSGWTGSGSLTVPSGTGTVTANKSANITLTNSSLSSSDGMSLSLRGINIAGLTVSAGNPAILDASAFSGVANLSATGPVSAILFGGSGGHDTLTAAGSGRDILIGNGASDTLTDAGSGRNFLIGAGAGGDTLTGNGNDISVSGTTNDDSDTSANIAALDAILAEWTSNASYANRIKTLKKGVGKKHIDALSSHTIRMDSNPNTLADVNSRIQKGDWFLVSKRDSVTKNRKETKTII